MADDSKPKANVESSGMSTLGVVLIFFIIMLFISIIIYGFGGSFPTKAPYPNQ